MNITHPENIIPELMTLDQAAALCNVSPRTLWGWARDGSAPPPVKIGKGKWERTKTRITTKDDQGRRELTAEGREHLSPNRAIHIQ